jgi:hypothetical protein
MIQRASGSLLERSHRIALEEKEDHGGLPNTVKWGDGIVGVESAAKTYFGESASELTPSEAALLVPILPNPHSWSSTNPGLYVKERQRRILKDVKRLSSSRTLSSRGWSPPALATGRPFEETKTMPSHTA